MNSPRSGFRRAATASWALAGIGVAGVGGVSALAYADTVKPAVEAAPIVEQHIVEQPVEIAPQAVPVSVLPTPSPVTPAPTKPPVSQAPLAAAPAPAAPAPAYKPVPVPQYVPPPAPAYTAPPAPVAAAPPVAPQQPVAAPAPSQGFPIRQSHTPLGGGRSSGNKFTPPHTASRGS